MKKALLVGVNGYLHPDITDLSGCVNDVLNLRDILKTFFGFTNDGIHVLTDARATHLGIMQRLHRMVLGAEPGDQLLFHFSGHGTQIRDRDGDELADGLDEMICPADMDWDGSPGIVDDALAGVLDQLPDGVTMEVILDCCHSGTGIRKLKPEFGPLPDSAIFNSRLIEWCSAPRPNIRYTPPPVDIACRAEGEDQELTINRLLLTNQHLSKPVLWAGCKSRQTSADAYIDGAYNGAFTYHFCKVIRESNGRISRANLIKAVRELLSPKYEQEPQLETKEPGRITGNIFE